MRFYLDQTCFVRLAVVVMIATVSGCTQADLAKIPPKIPPKISENKMKLTHEQTLEWIHNRHAWQLARKTKPIWARPITADEIGKEFQTADHVKEKAQEGYWLCVGVAGEPWFQKPDRVEAKYDPGHEESKQFSFDSAPQTYRVYKPKGDIRNWAAQVDGPDIEGFSIRPNYDVEHPLYSKAGGYVVKDHVSDPYADKPNDVWLVQQPLFESTYEFVQK